MSTDRFRIPPKELEEMLPQQSLLLRLAAEAIADAGWDERTRLRCGCLVGLGLDMNATNFHARWSLLDKAREWDDRLGLGLSDEGLADWVEELRDAFGPPLRGVQRTMGAAGRIVASPGGATSSAWAARGFTRLERGDLRASGRRVRASAAGMIRRGSWTRRSSGRSTYPANSGRRSPRPSFTLRRRSPMARRCWSSSGS